MATTAVEQDPNSGGFLGTIERGLDAFFNFKLVNSQIRADQQAATGASYDVGQQGQTSGGGFLDNMDWWQMGLLIAGVGVAAWGVSKAFGK